MLEGGFSFTPLFCYALRTVLVLSLGVFQLISVTCFIGAICLHREQFMVVCFWISLKYCFGLLLVCLVALFV